MLKEKSLENEVVTIKLTSGEEVMGLVQNESAAKFEVNTPLAMFSHKEDGKQMTIGFAPFMLGLDDNGVVSIYKSSISGIAVARSDATSAYKNAAKL